MKENIFEYVQSKHVCGIISGLLYSLSTYIEPRIIVEAIKFTAREFEKNNTVLLNQMKINYNTKEEYRTDFEPGKI